MQEIGVNYLVTLYKSMENAKKLPENDATPAVDDQKASVVVRKIPKRGDSELPRFRPLRPSEVVNKKRVVYAFDGEWAEIFGQPEQQAKIFITGASFGGKSTFTYKFCKYLQQFGKVWYNSFEEGDTLTSGMKLKDMGIEDGQNFRLIDRYPIAAFKQQMLRRNAAKMCVIDSIQHAGMNKKMYDDFSLSLSNVRRGKMCIFISHHVKDSFTMHVRHDCDIKIEIIRFIARIESRYTGKTIIHVLYEEGAKKHWGKKYKSIINGHFWPGIWK